MRISDWSSDVCSSDLGDASYELKTVFADKLNAPYGMALVGNTLYVANQDALVKFDYTAGQTKASGAPVKVVDLPSRINHHWTKIGSASCRERVCQYV